MEASTDATSDDNFASVAAEQHFHAVIDFTNNSLASVVYRWQNKGSTEFKRMQRYSITTPLVAIRLCQSNDTGDTEKKGVMASLPSEAVVQIQGRSNLGTGMIEVSWERQRYAVFEQDLKERARVESKEALAD